MPKVIVEIPEDAVQRFNEIAEKLNVSRAKNGQEPIAGITVMEVVLAKFVGLTAGEDELARAIATQGFWWSPPHGG